MSRWSGPRYCITVSGEGIVVETHNLTVAERDYEAICRQEPTRGVTLHDACCGTIVRQRADTAPDSDCPF